MTQKDRINLDDTIRLLKCIEDKPKISQTEIAQTLKISVSTFKRMVKKLEKLDITIENIGSTRKPNYKIKSWGMINMNELLGIKSECESEKATIFPIEITDKEGDVCEAKNSSTQTLETQ